MNVKQEVISMLDLMGDNEVGQILQFIKTSFRIKSKTWDDIEEDDPTTDEIEAIEAYLSAK